MKHFIIYNKDCLGAENRQYSPFSELKDGSVDVVITSPPYNNGNCSYESVLRDYALEEECNGNDIALKFSDNYSIAEYEERFNVLFFGVFRILKTDGIFIIDINSEAKCGNGETIPLFDFAINAAKKANLSLFKKYSYQIMGEEPVGHGKTQFVLLFTKTDKGKSKYEYLNIGNSNTVVDNPFQDEYDFSRSVPREVCWPPELLFDFIEVFRLRKGKTIVDPFSGESALGLIINTQTGINASRFIGYEIVDKVAKRAIDYSKREFGIESILFGRSFRDSFEYDTDFQKKWNLSYIGAIVLDGNTDPFLFDIHYADPQNIFRQRLTAVSNTIRRENLPYLGSILGRVDFHDAHLGNVYIYNENGNIFVRYGSNNISDKDFEHEFDLKEKELRCFRIHCKTLKKNGEFISFIPMVFRNNLFASILYYIVACGESYINSKIYAMSNNILQKCQTASAPIQDRRIKTLSGQFYEKSIRSAIGSIMSRNGSHNIGSHVLSALTHHIGTMPDDRILYQYIQQRMDYIANVTTEFPSWTTSTMFVGDIMKTFLSQHHLLEYVSESEGLHSYRFQEPSIKAKMPKEQEGKIRLHIRRIERDKQNSKITRFIRYGNEYTHYPPDENFNIWDKDIALAIPGGVVGQHAFFTILENIIRNAAKHGWAEIPPKDKQSLNLDIYISFEEKDGQDEKGRYIEFTVWDNMSNVLRPLTKDDSINRRLKQFLLTLSQVPESDSAKMTLDTDGTIARSAWIKKTFFNQNNDKDFVDTLRSVTRENFRVFLKKPLTSAEIEAIKNQKDYKTFVPLNMQQQILLTQTFIGEQGELKRENWGMAEMRISAGFLWHYAVDEIGGLLDLKTDEYIIKPVPVDSVVSCPDNLCGNKECSRTLCKYKERNNLLECPKKRNRHYHLGYRFKMHLPREILIVFQSTDRAAISNITSDKAAEFKKQGVYFAVSDNNEFRRFPEEIDPSTGKHRTYATYNFDYIVLPSLKDTIKTNPATENGASQPQTPSDYEILSCLPFRLLVGTTADANKTERKKALINYKGIFDLLQKDIGEKSAIDLKCIVYKAWLGHLMAPYKKQEDKSDKNQKKKDDDSLLTLQLQTGGSSGSSQGLFTNYDLLKYVFKNLYHSVITRAISDNDSDIGTIMRMIASYPAPHELLPEKDNLSDDIYNEIKEILKRICGKILEAYPALHKLASSGDPESGTISEDGESPEEKTSAERKSRNDFIRTYFDLLKEDDSGIMEFIKTNSTMDFEQKIADFTDIDEFSEDMMMAMLNGKKDVSPFSALVEPTGSSVLAKALNTAFLNCNDMLRKREDLIATLPRIYSADSTEKGTREYDSRENVELFQKAGIDVTSGQKSLIKYCRHNKIRNEGMIYAEGLSGSQSYLNQLHRIAHNFKDENIGMFVRLAENALLRVLIIDERVSKFLHEHEQMEKTYRAMNIDVVNITEDKQGDASNMKLPLNQLNLHDKDSLKKWDILIIHQGIIDKWFSNHTDADVRRLLCDLQDQVPYTVITTGRGRPDNVPNEAKILPFSTLKSTLFCEYPEKLLLVGTVMNILPPD